MKKINANLLAKIDKSEYWVRHFLICNRYARYSMQWPSDGNCNLNFAQIIQDERKKGIHGRTQMTNHFWVADLVQSEIGKVDEHSVFGSLEEDDDISIGELASLTGEQLDYLYQEIVLQPKLKKYTVKAASSSAVFYEVEAASESDARLIFEGGSHGQKITSIARAEEND